MRPQRQVRRSSTRPTYARRRPSAPKRPRQKLQLPAIKVTWVRLAAIIILVVLLFIGIGTLTSLKRITVRHNNALTTDHITNVARTALDKQWFGGNVILVNTSALAHSLEQADPGIKKASVHRSLFHGITIDITERQPTLNWKSGGTTYLLDADATAIGPTKGAYTTLPTVTDSSNLPVKTGDRVAPTSFVSFAADIAKLLPAAGYVITDMTVPTTTSELNVRTSTGLVIKFDTTRPPGEQIADLQAVQKELAKAKKTPTEYIDLRIEHKAYYK